MACSCTDTSAQICRDFETNATNSSFYLTVECSSLRYVIATSSLRHRASVALISCSYIAHISTECDDVTQASCSVGRVSYDCSVRSITAIVPTCFHVHGFVTG